MTFNARATDGGFRHGFDNNPPGTRLIRDGTVHEYLSVEREELLRKLTAFVAESDNRVIKTQRLAVQAEVLQKHPPETEVILRTSAIANAVTSIGRMFKRPSSEMVSASDQRDLVLRWILVASYLNEAVVILNKRHDGLAWRLAELGVEAGRTLPPEMPLDRLRECMASKSSFVETCDHIRDKFAFHIDKEPIMDWVTGRPALEGVGVVSQFGPHHEDIVFDAASFAIFEATEKLLVDDFDKTLSEVVLALPYLVEAMLYGLAKSRSLSIQATEKDGDNIVFIFEPGTKFGGSDTSTLVVPKETQG